MCTSKECVQIITAHIPHIQKEFGVVGITLFGSVARGDNHSGSDVDILVDMPPKGFLMSALKDYLEELLQTSVDLIRHHSHLSQRFLNQIFQDGIKIL